MKTHPSPRTRGFALMEGLLVLTILTYLFLGLMVNFPLTTLGLYGFGILWLIGLRVRNVVLLWRKTGHAPLRVNKELPLLRAAVALIMLTSVQLLILYAQASRVPGEHHEHSFWATAGAFVATFVVFTANLIALGAFGSGAVGLLEEKLRIDKLLGRHRGLLGA